MSEAANVIYPQELTVTFEQDANGSGPALSSGRESEDPVFRERSKAAFENALKTAHIDIPPVLASTVWCPSDGHFLPSSRLDRRPPVPDCVARAVASDLLQYVSENFENWFKRTKLSQQSFNDETQDVGWDIHFNAREPYFYIDSTTQKMMLRCETSIWAYVGYKGSSRSLIPNLSTKFEALVPAKLQSYDEATTKGVRQGFGYTANPPPPDCFEPLIGKIVNELLDQPESVKESLWWFNPEIPQELRSYALSTRLTYYDTEDVTRVGNTYRAYHLHQGFAVLPPSINISFDVARTPEGRFYCQFFEVDVDTGVPR